MKGLFITGTDTDAGKTTVTAALLRALKVAGVPAAAVKPVQTGCVMRGGEEENRGEAASHEGASVSYTHLDVYKRQNPSLSDFRVDKNKTRSDMLGGFLIWRNSGKRLAHRIGSFSLDRNELLLRGLPTNRSFCGRGSGRELF